MPKSPQYDGTHVRGICSYAEDDPNVCKIDISIWPLPSSISLELYNSIENHVNQFLTERGISNGDKTNLSTGKQRPN